MKAIYDHKRSFALLLLFFLLVQTSCKKWVDVPVPELTSSVAGVYNDNGTAASVLTGIYANMSDLNATAFTSGAGSTITNMSVFASLSADELTLYSYNNTQYNSFQQYYTNALVSNYPLSSRPFSIDYWNMFYPVIFTCNSAIEGLNGSKGLTPAIKQQLTGEAEFMRAFCYFYLVNLYGPVPLITSTDWKVNSAMLRTPVIQVNQQILSDLKDAEFLLSENYLNGDALTTARRGRYRPTKWAAAALLAREYLFIKDWANAETQATLVLSESRFSLNDPASSFGTFSSFGTEAIWQLQPVNTTPYSNTGDGAFFNIPDGPNATNNVYLSNDLVNSFEPGDLRKTGWVDSVTVGNVTYYYPYKYKLNGDPSTSFEAVVMLRLGEQYLIRAEARAELGDVNGAQDDINAIRTRAGLPNTTAADQPSLLTAVMKERRVELFTEWGHRWLDLKRTGEVDAVMSVATPLKGGTWNADWQWYPIPATEIKAAPQLTQNAGY